MPVKLAILLSEHNARNRRAPLPEVSYVLLERTLHDPPRASAASRWAEQLRRTFPNAELIPFMWHLVSHGVDDGLREHGSRSLPGSPHAFGALQDTPETRQAWAAVSPAFAALGVERIALRTPASISPGVLGRKRIESFVEARRADGLATIWEPEGLWEPEEATHFAASIGAQLMWRAFVGGRPDRGANSTLIAPSAWLRIEGLVRNPRINEDQLDALIEHAEERADAVFVFSGPLALANLARTQEALEL